MRKRVKDFREQVVRGQARVRLLQQRYKAHQRLDGWNKRAWTGFAYSKGWRRFLWRLWGAVVDRRVRVLERQIKSLNRGLGKFGAAWAAHLLDSLESLSGARGLFSRLRSRALRVRLDSIRSVEADRALTVHLFGRVGGGGVRSRRVGGGARRGR